MAKVIEFYIPKTFTEPAMSAPDESGRVIEFACRRNRLNGTQRGRGRGRQLGAAGRQQVPRLRGTIRFANHTTPLGMTVIGE